MHNYLRIALIVFIYTSISACTQPNEQSQAFQSSCDFSLGSSVKYSDPPEEEEQKPESLESIDPFEEDLPWIDDEAFAAELRAGRAGY